jgi:pyridoxal 5'-phosphate synthase pdxS subunit
MPQDELLAFAKEIAAPLDLVIEVHNAGKLPVVNFAAGGVATPADAALMMKLGAEGVFVGSGIFKSSNPQLMAQAIVRATTHYQDPSIIAEVSKGLGQAMPGLEIGKIPPEQLLAGRGW